MGQNPPPKVKLNDIAKNAGVSLMTVSRVLNNHPHVNPITRERVLRIANNLGYIPHASARALATGQTKMIGLIVGSIHSEYLLEIIRGISDETWDQGYNLVLVTSGHNRKEELSQVSLLMGGLVDGILLILPREADRYLKLVSHHRLPCVLIDHRNFETTLPMVRASNYEGMYEATKYLCQLGHTRIGFIKGITEDGTTVERFKGYQQALSESGLPEDESLVKQGDYETKSGYLCTIELLNHDPKPTAIIASNDQMAFGVISAIQESGFTIPEDVSVMGFDDIPTAERIFPPLTTIHQPLYEMGREGVRFVIDEIQGIQRFEKIKILPTRLVIRKSTQLFRNYENKERLAALIT